jgi:hypothetical protein
MIDSVPPDGSVPREKSLTVEVGTVLRPTPSHSVPSYSSWDETPRKSRPTPLASENRPSGRNLGRSSVPRFHVRGNSSGTEKQGVAYAYRKKGGRI